LRFKLQISGTISITDTGIGEFCAFCTVFKHRLTFTDCRKFFTPLLFFWQLLKLTDPQRVSEIC